MLVAADKRLGNEGKGIFSPGGRGAGSCYNLG
jgi:hypothetical protein